MNKKNLRIPLIRIVFVILVTFTFSLCTYLSRKIYVVNNNNVTHTIKKIGYLNDEISLGQVGFKGIIFTLLLTFCLICIVFVISKIISDHPIKLESRTLSKKYILILFVIILLGWLPYMLNYFPGGVFSDTFASIRMAEGKATLANQQPIFYTFSWQFLLWIGKLLHFNNSAVLFTYVILQAIFASLTVCYLIMSLARVGLPNFLLLFFTVFFALLPIIPLYIVSLWKDTPFSILFLFYSTIIFNLYWNNYWKGTIISYFICSFCLAFSRSNGLYIVVGMSLIILLSKKQDVIHSRTFKLLTVVLIMLILIVRGPFFTYLGFNKTDKVESTGIPIQQTAYIIIHHGKITQKDKNVVNNEIMPIRYLKVTYQPLIVDSIKWSPKFQAENFNRNYYLFISTYIHLLSNNKMLAIKGALLANEGFWDWTRQVNIGYSSQQMTVGVPYKNINLLKKYFGLQFSAKYLPRISSALVCWFVILLSLIPIVNKGFMSIFPIYPAVILWLTTLVATPIAFSFRYVFAVLLIIPISIVTVFMPKVNDRLRKIC